MKKAHRLLQGFASTLLCVGSASASIDNTNQPTTFLGPTVEASYTHLLSQKTAVSFAGEAGVKNFRLGGTLGWTLVENQRIKLSGEYLTQDLTYSFLSGNTNQWVQQGAIGADYQYEFLNHAYKPQFDLSVYYSNAPSKNLNPATITYQGLSNVINYRRIAGSNAGGISPGITVQPWHGGKVGVALNYDDVVYETHYLPSDNPIGFGGTAHLDQMLTNNLSLGLLAAVRQPFNNYEANLMWATIPNLRVGVNAAYTTGKNSLPNSYNAGILLSYMTDSPAQTDKNQPMLTQNSNKNTIALASESQNDLSAWTASPAVYMPQVLAIADQTTNLTACTQPVAVGVIPNISFISPATSQATKPYFTGDNLTFTVSPTAATNVTISIDSSTGLLTVAGLGPIVVPETLTITARNKCGAAISTTTVT